MKTQPLPFSRKLRQFRYHTKRLNKLLRTGEFAELSATARTRLVQKVKGLYHQLTGKIGSGWLRNALAGVAFVLSLSFGQEANAQSFQLPQTNPFGIIPQNTHTMPAFADMDNDGDQDFFAGTYNGTIVYFEDTSSTSTPAFAAPVSSPFGISQGFIFTMLDLVDIDNDGDMDLFVGEYFGQMKFYQNTGTASAPAFSGPVTNPFGISSGLYYNIPAFADLDNDGDYDLLTVEYYGNVRYFQNTGTASAPAFATPVVNPFGLGPANGTVYFSFPSFADLDGDSDLDLLMGGPYGNMYYYANTGTQSTPAFAQPQTNPFGLAPTSFMAALDLVDIDNDGDADLFANSSVIQGMGIAGDLLFYENTGGGTFNAPPVLGPVANQTICEGDPIGPLPFSVSDPNNDPVTLSATSSNPGLVPNANIQIQGTAPNYTLTATPAAGQTGQTDLTIVANDGTDTTRTTFSVTVNACNNVPSIQPVGTQTICDGQPLGPIPLSVSDPDNDPLSVTATSSNQALIPDAGIAIGGSAPNYTLTATPAAGQTGFANITVSVSDGLNPPVTMGFAVSVTPCNTPPVISPMVAQTICDGDSLKPVGLTVADADSDPLTLSATSNNQTILPNANLGISGTMPNYTLTGLTRPGQSGTVVITVTADDGQAQKSETLVVQVVDCNNSPVISAIPDQLICQNAAFGPVSFTALDSDGDPVSISAYSNNQTLLPDGNLTISGTAPNFTIEGTPAPGQTGSAQVTVFAFDGMANGGYTFDVTIDACLSVEPENLLVGLQVYPVPASDQLTARWEVPAMITEVRVLDVKGREVMLIKPNSVRDRQVLDISGLTRGVYLLAIRSEAGVITRKFVKR